MEPNKVWGDEHMLLARVYECEIKQILRAEITTMRSNFVLCCEQVASEDYREMERVIKIV